MSISMLEQDAIDAPDGEAYRGELRVRAYRQIGGSKVICDYTIRGISTNRANAISYMGWGKTLAERGLKG